MMNRNGTPRYTLYIVFLISIHLYSLVFIDVIFVAFPKLFYLRFHYSIFVSVCFFFIIVEVHCKRPVAS